MIWLLNTKIIKFLGKISYSLYISHWVIRDYFVYFYSNKFMDYNHFKWSVIEKTNSNYLTLYIAAICLIFSIILHYLIEDYFGFWLLNKLINNN